MIRIVTSRSCINSKRFLSHGALAGGFTSEALKQWAIRQWGDQNEPYVDLFSHRVPNECIVYLNNQKHPSGELVKCFFGSNQFALERTLLSPFFFKSLKTPEVFSINEQYLAWTVAVETPLEIICTWELNETVKGCTMIAYDPQLRKIFNGNCIHSTVTENGIFKAMVPLHTKYAQFLLSGMVQEIERKAKM